MYRGEKLHVGDGMIVVVARARRVKGPQKDIEGYCHDDVGVMTAPRQVGMSQTAQPCHSRASKV